jgi:hypothetical protein
VNNMAITYGKTTYNEIIYDVRCDVNESKLARLSDQTIQRWTLEAEKQVCDRIEIIDSYVLGLNDGVVKYYHQDRPVISTGTATTPIVLSSTAHGLVAGDRCFVSGVAGLSGANGKRYVSAKTTDTFTIKEAVDILGATNETPIEITTDGVHGWTTADTVTITGVTGNTAANVTNNAITVVDTTHFTLDGITGNATYISGGLAVKNTVGSGTYTGGGRYWKDDEIPTYFKKFLYGDRFFGSIKKEVRTCDMMELRNKERQVSESFASYSDDNSPFLMAEASYDFQRYQEVYPEPISDHNLTLYGVVKITPKDYASDLLTTNIHLSQDHEEMIKHYVKYKIYKWLKDDVRAGEEILFFEREIKTMSTSSMQPLQMRVTYK